MRECGTAIPMHAESFAMAKADRTETAMGGWYLMCIFGERWMGCVSACVSCVCKGLYVVLTSFVKSVKGPAGLVAAATPSPAPAAGVPVKYGKPPFQPCAHPQSRPVCHTT